MTTTIEPVMQAILDGKVPTKEMLSAEITAVDGTKTSFDVDGVYYVGDFALPQTPLGLAVGKKNLAAMEALFENGANPNKPNDLGFTPFVVAKFFAARGEDMSAPVAKLRQHYATITAEDATAAIDYMASTTKGNAFNNAQNQIFFKSLIDEVPVNKRSVVEGKLATLAANKAAEAVASSASASNSVLAAQSAATPTSQTQGSTTMPNSNVPTGSATPAAPSAPSAPTVPTVPAVDPLEAIKQQVADMQRQLAAANEKIRLLESGAATKASVKDEEKGRKDADTALGGRIDKEAKDRVDADAALGGRVDKEVKDRTDANAALGGRVDKEAKDRADADTALGGRVTEEEAARQKADKKESKARKAGDKKLQEGIDAEAATRESKDKQHDESLNDHEVRIKYTENEIGMTRLHDGRFTDETAAMEKIAEEAGVDFKAETGKAYTMKGADAAKVRESREKVISSTGTDNAAEKNQYKEAVQHAVDGATVSSRTSIAALAEAKASIAESKKLQKDVDKDAPDNHGKSSQERALAIGEKLVALGMDPTKGNYAKLKGDAPTHELEYASNKGLARLEQALEKAGKDDLITSKEMEALSKMYNSAVLEPGIHKIPTAKVPAEKGGHAAP